MSEREIHRALSSEARAEILSLLYKKPHDVEELAKKLKLKPVTIRHHLQSLQEAGLLEYYEERSGSAGRPKTYYKIAKLLPSITFPDRRYLMFSTILINSIKRILGTEQTQQILSDIGHEMGKEMVKQMENETKTAEWTPEKLKEVFVGKYLQESGTQPELIEGNSKKVVVRLHNCVFFELAQQMPDLMCDVLHKKFFQGIAENMKDGIKEMQTTCMGRGDNYCEHVFEWHSNERKNKNGKGSLSTFQA